ncbi:SLC35F6, partial [Symbiodinium microadriaticum]
FLAALIFGTGCSLTSKVMLDMEAVGMDGQMEKFSFPLFQTFGMFIGMTAALFMHSMVLKFQIPFPGYNHNKKGYSAIEGGAALEVAQEIPTWMYFLLIVPALFDLVATALCMYGLRYVNVSIYQMLRGAAIVFVALLKQFVLKDTLRSFMWIGVFWNVVSIVLVGVTAMFSSPESDDQAENKPLVGVILILAGALVQSLQYAFEERVMAMEIAAPPLLLIGMEGFWGSIVCVFVLYPIAYFCPGADHGSYENPFNTLTMISNSTDIQVMFFFYFIFIFGYNMLACLVTFMLNSVWHAILDNFRPITVWGTDLFIFYIITTSFGESWTVWSWLQLLGMGVLLYGTAVYNAPNAGSIKLTGGLLDCFMDFSEEYDEAERDIRMMVSAGEEPAIYTTTMSPFMSPRTMKSPRSPRREPLEGYGTSGGFVMGQVRQSSFA